MQTGMAAFQEQLYKCMLGQALQMKGSMELHRATNQFGTMIWCVAEAQWVCRRRIGDHRLSLLSLAAPGS